MTIKLFVVPYYVEKLRNTLVDVLIWFYTNTSYVTLSLFLAVLIVSTMSPCRHCVHPNCHRVIFQASDKNNTQCHSVLLTELLLVLEHVVSKVVTSWSYFWKSLFLLTILYFYNWQVSFKLKPIGNLDCSTVKTLVLLIT